MSKQWPEYLLRRVAKNVARLRNHKYLTMKQLADKSGVHYLTIFNIECQANFTIESGQLVALALDLNLSDLLQNKYFEWSEARLRELYNPLGHSTVE